MDKHVRESNGVPNRSANIPSRFWPIAFAGLIALAISFTFWPALEGEFLNWDDDRNFLDNPAFAGVGFEQLRWAWNTYHLGVWQPLSWALLGVQFEIGQLDTQTYHAVSIGLHVINTLLVFLITVCILRADNHNSGPFTLGRYIAATIAALLFGVHPLRVEVVAWVSCQPYLPAVLFFLLAILVYLWGFGDKNAVAFKRWAAWIATLICYGLAVASKAVAITLPAVLLILDVYPLRRHSVEGAISFPRLVRIVLEKAPLVLIALLVAIWAVQAKDAAQPGRPEAIDWNANLAQSAYGLTFYLVKTIAPTSLAAFYKMPENLSLLRWPYFGAAIGVVVIGTALIVWRRRCPAALAAWIAYVVILLPNLGLLRISRQIATDRYSYLAVLPLVVLLAGGMHEILSRRSPWAKALGSAVIALGVTAVFALGAGTRSHLATWANSVSLWKANLKVDPECAHAACMLGHALAERKEWDESANYLMRAIELRPDFSFAHANLGTVLLLNHKYREAISRFETALEGDSQLDQSGLARVHFQLAIAYHKLDQQGAAWKHLRLAQRLGFPGDRIIEIARAFEAERGRSRD